MGAGAGLLYVPSLALVGIWFNKRRSIAMGIVTSGIAIGMVQIMSLPTEQPLPMDFSMANLAC